MKIFLSHGYFVAEDAKEQAIMRPYPPLGLLYVAAHLREEGHHVRVHDSTFSDRSAWWRDLEHDAPDALALYVNLMTRCTVVELIREVRSHGSLSAIPVILGGPETRYHAEEFLSHGADVCVIGEGETTAAEVVKALKDRSCHELHDISGIAFRDHAGKVIRTTERVLDRDIDALPLPSRDLIDMGAYSRAWKQKHGHDAFSVSTMRGCPYTCRWCSRAVYGLSYRRRSPAKVVDELEHLVKTYSPDRFWFVDDVFTVSHKWLREFAQELEQRGVRIAYECITRADRMNTEVIELLKASGCVQVWIGAESGSQKIIDAMDRRVDVGQVQAMIRATKWAGIRAGTFIMLGYPGETITDIDRTVVHLKNSGPDDFTITVAY
ncbi:MAG: B12-binding domain-containing radical SAM protein, partial [Flavobacteriales bacterium]|nr:B12-binding domain-containing radical SAM protein [Flavobacteriales bacterium]